MSLISKEHLSLTLQNIKKLLSFKADKSEVKEVKSELQEEISKVSENIVQSDWGQNDENAADYIKNRTHWIGGSFNEILPETSVPSYENDSGLIALTEPIGLIVGNAYTVICNDKEYACTCVSSEIEGIPVLTLYERDLFEVYDLPEEYRETIGAAALVRNCVYLSTMHISVIDGGFYKLDKRFLPEMVGTIVPLGGELFNKAKDATGKNSHAEGCDTTASGENSHAEGYSTIASGKYSHAECYTTTASGFASHAEGQGTTASGFVSHAEGIGTTASGEYSHAEGYMTTASGIYSHAEGLMTTSASKHQHVQGKYNIEDANQTYAHIVGNGTAYNAHSNAHTLDWNGIGWYQGGLQVGGNAQDDGAKNVLLEGDAIPVPTTATVGQTIVVKSVNENGVPTEWEAVDPWVITSSTEGSTKKFKITIDDDGVLTATEIVEEAT